MVSRRTTCRVVVSIQATTPTCVPTRIFAPSVLRLNPSAPETGMHLTTCWVVTGITSTQFRSMALAKINWCTWSYTTAIGVSSVRTKEVLLFGSPGGPCVTVIVAWLEEFRPPLDPLKITVEAPSAAVEDAVRVTDCPPVVIEKGAAGDKVTPLGRPVTETSIPWLNPFMAFTERFSVALCPAPMDWFCGLTPIEKLGDGAGPIPDELEPPPQDAKRSASSDPARGTIRSEEHTSELQSRLHLVCRLLLEKKKNNYRQDT